MAIHQLIGLTRIIRKVDLNETTVCHTTHIDLMHNQTRTSSNDSNKKTRIIACNALGLTLIQNNVSWRLGLIVTSPPVTSRP
jgi:hypothetical protein